MDRSNSNKELLPTPTEAAEARALRSDRWYQSKAFRRFIRNPLAISGVTLLLFFLGVAILAPIITAPQIAERYRGHTCARDLGLSRGEEGIAELRNPTTAVFWRALVVPPHELPEGAPCQFFPHSRTPIRRTYYGDFG
jgi:hypothetical protein